MSTERVLVDDQIADQFIEKLIEKTKTIEAANPLQGNYPLGVLESEKAANRLRLLLEDAQDKRGGFATRNSYSGCYDAADYHCEYYSRNEALS